MAILKIARMGHPVLLQKAEEVPDPTAPEIKQLVADMIETMDDAHGRGLAANQVHVAKRVVVFHPPADPTDDPTDEDAEDREAADADEEEGEADDPPVLALINPTLEVLDDELVPGWEGCLSVPEMRGVVPRFSRVRYSGTTPDGKQFEREVSGYHARVVQHEFDHLDGILYPMRMEDLGLLVFESEFHHYLGSSDDESSIEDDDDESEDDETDD
ncbi:MAG: peptide deformylase [Alphaproteobacteria bacterium]|jgi:peptide deformylase|nr:peptide deformylase [Alphaproteobacteria bacterium]